MTGLLENMGLLKLFIKYLFIVERMWKIWGIWLYNTTNRGNGYVYL